jgi:hypothetical protein
MRLSGEHFNHLVLTDTQMHNFTNTQLNMYKYPNASPITLSHCPVLFGSCSNLPFSSYECQNSLSLSGGSSDPSEALSVLAACSEDSNGPQVSSLVDELSLYSVLGVVGT